MTSHVRNAVGVLLLFALPVAGVGLADAQGAPAPVRIALLPQWVVSQHGTTAPPGVSPEFRAALENGVVDRVVFRWQRGAIQRSSLVGKPIRVVSGPEASALGGRGEFQLGGVRPPLGAAAWTEVDVAPKTGQAEDVVILEIGGELNTVTQVLEAVFVIPPGGALQAFGLARRAVIPGDGILVLGTPFGRPVTVAGGPARFRGAGGVELLVARSQVEAVVNGGVTVNGLADVAPHAGSGTGDWREGDRVFVRVSLATLRAGAPAIVLGWKDRTLSPDPNGEQIQRSSLEVPFRR